jgi:hypothetical protein
MPKVSQGAFAERHPAARLKIAVMPGRWASQRTCQQYFETRRVITAALAGVE